MTERPVLPLWVPNFLADTGHLSCAETGAYALLLMHAWLDPDASLPNDPAILARMTHNHDGRNWQRIAPKVLPFFKVGPDGRLRQKRLTAELQKIREISAERKAAAKKRWGRPVDKPVDSCERSRFGVTVNASPSTEKRNASKINGASMQKVEQTAATLNLIESESIATSHEAATARATTTNSKNLKNGKLKEENSAPYRATPPAGRPASNAVAKRDVSPRSHTGNPRQAWERKLAEHLGPDLYAKVIPILERDPALCQRATTAERRQPGSGAVVVAVELRKPRRSP